MKQCMRNYVSFGSLLVILSCEQADVVLPTMHEALHHTNADELMLGDGASSKAFAGTPNFGRPGLVPSDFPSDFVMPGTPSLSPGFEDDFAPIVGVPAPYPVCGNGIVEPTEQCDDGNDDNQDGCNVICMLPMCGNGVLELGEQCDDNLATGSVGCTTDCRFITCGNKITEKTNGEECDDGNHEAGDGCSPCCLFEKCGNSIIDPGEQCDDGNTVSGDGCSSTCQLESLKKVTG